MGWRLRHLLEDVSSFFFSWRCSCARCSRRSWFVEASWFICEVQIWRLGFLKTHAAIVAVPLCPPNRRCMRTAIYGDLRCVKGLMGFMPIISQELLLIAEEWCTCGVDIQHGRVLCGMD